MRRSDDQCSKTPNTPPGGSDRPSLPNAFSPEFLDRLRRKHDHPPTPEAASAGPFSVHPAEIVPPSRRREAPPFPWRCLCAGESAPRACLADPDLAYLTAAALPLTGRAPRFALVEDLDAEEDRYLLVSGWGNGHVDVGTVLGWNEDLPEVLTVLDGLRVRPLALAQFLLSVGNETLARVGRILSELATGTGEVTR